MSGRLYRQVRAPGVVDDGPFPRPSGGRRPRAVPLKSVLGDAGADTGDPLAMVRGQRHALAISDAADAQCAGRLDDLPFLPTGTGPARCGRLQAPRGAPAAIGERFGQAIVRHEALGHGRDRLAAGRVKEADGPPRLTVEATWGPDVGSVRIEVQSSIVHRRKAIKSSWQISGKRRLPAFGHATGRGLDPA